MFKLTKQTSEKKCVYSHRKCLIIWWRCVFFTGKDSSRSQSILFWLLIIIWSLFSNMGDIFHRQGSLWWVLAAQNKPIKMRKEKWVWDEYGAPGPAGGQHVSSLQWRKSISADSSSRSLLIRLNLSACFPRSRCCIGLLHLLGYI